MIGNNNQNQFAAIEVIQGNNQYVRENYNREAEGLRQSFPSVEPLPEIPEVEKEQNLLESIRMSNERELEQIIQDMPLPDNSNTNGNGDGTISPGNNGKKKRNVLTQKDLDYIKAIYEIQELTIEQKIQRIQGKMTISRSYCMQLLRKLKSGKSIDKSVVKKGRKLKYHTDIAKDIADKLNQDNQTTDFQLAEHCSQKFNFHCSRSGIQRVRTNKKIMKAAGLLPYTYKVCTRRGRSSNTPANKLLRKKVACDVHCSKERYKMAFIDETHWQIFSRKNYAKSPKGTKALVHQQKTRCNMTGIMAMTRDGPLYTSIIKNTPVTADIFQDYFIHVINMLPPNQRFCFYMDNARIHKKSELRAIVENTGHKIIFGAPYSPEMNPIEMVFSNWKEKVDTAIRNTTPSTTEIERVIQETWDSLEIQTFTNCVAHVYEEVYPKVVNMEDI